MASLSTIDLTIGWISGLYLCFFSFGTGMALSVMYVEITEVFQTSNSESSLVQSVYTGIALGCGLVWNYPSSKFGIGNCIVTSAFIGSVGLLVSAFAVNVTMIIVFTGIIGGLGFSFCFIAPSLVINSLFNKNKRTLLAAITTGSSLGQFALSFLMEYCLETYHWSGAFLIFSGLGFNCVVSGFLIRMLEKKAFSMKRANTGTSTKEIMLKPSILLDWKNTTLILLSFVLTFATCAAGKFIVDLMVLNGFQRSTGSLFASILGLSNLLGRIFGTITTACMRTSALAQASIAAIVMAVSNALMSYLASFEGLLIVTILNGVTWGVLGSKVGLYCLEVAGPHDFPSEYAFYILLNGAGTFFGGFIGGIIKDITGNYDLMFTICTAVSLLAAVQFFILAFMVQKQQRIFQQSSPSEATEHTTLLGRDEITK